MFQVPNVSTIFGIINALLPQCMNFTASVTSIQFPDVLHYFGVINVPPQRMNFPASVTFTCQRISPLLADWHPMHLDGGFWGKSAQEGCVLTFDKSLLFFSWSIIWHAYNANKYYDN